MPHTMIDVVDDPVDGIVPADVVDELPPAGAFGVTGVAAAVITNVAVLAPLTLPTMLTVYEPAVRGEALKLPVAFATAA